MKISDRPINLKDYYKLMIEHNTKKIKSVQLEKDKLELESKELHKEFKDNIETFKENFKVNLNDYEEFINNKYITGKFYKVANGLFINRNNNYELVADLYNLVRLAEIQKKIKLIEDDIKFCNKLLNLSLADYTTILKTYYTQVHKELILNGHGYSFSNGIGWICVNRCLIKKRRPKLDFHATKLREAELKAKGARIWNKEEAEWCAKNGIEYKAEDKRVFLNNEYCYQIPLINSKLPNAFKLKLEISDYRHRQCRNCTSEDLIARCDNDTNKICELPVDVKTKLTLCDKVDKILYTKFIRNENQESLKTTKINRQDR